VTLALYENAGGVLDLASPLQTTTTNALALVDFLYRLHGTPARVRLEAGQRCATVSYRRTRKDGSEHVWESEYILRVASDQ
jgi:hypothetical protein